MSMNLYVACPTARLPSVDDLQHEAKTNGVELVVPSLDWTVQSGFRPMLIHGRNSGVEVDVWTGTVAAEKVETFGLPDSGCVVVMTWSGELSECACAFTLAGAVAGLMGGTILDPNYDLRFGVSDAFKEARAAIRMIE